MARACAASAARARLRSDRAVAVRRRAVRLDRRARESGGRRRRLLRVGGPSCDCSRSGTPSRRDRTHRNGGRMTEDHPNAELTRRVFAAFNKNAMVISAALSRDIVWRVPGNTAMSGEYRGRRDVVEFLRRTGLETDGTYGSKLHTVLANDEWGLAVYRAWGTRNGMDLAVEQ